MILTSTLKTTLFPTPSISVVTATLNSAETVCRLLSSLSTQSSVSWEHLIVDGGSTDETIALIQSFMPDPRIRIVCSEPDRSLYEAWNKALPLLSGKWAIFVGADDYFASSRVIAEVVHWSRLYGDNECKALCSVVLDESFAPVRHYGDFGSYSKWTPSALDVIRGTFRTWPHPGIFYNTRLFKSGALFDPSYRIAGDVKFDVFHNISSASLFVPVESIVHVAGGLSSRPGMHYIRFLEASRLTKEFARPRPLFSSIYYCLRARIADGLGF